MIGLKDVSAITGQAYKRVNAYTVITSGVTETGQRVITPRPAGMVADFLVMPLDEASFAIGTGGAATIACGDINLLAAMLQAIVQDATI